MLQGLPGPSLERKWGHKSEATVDEQRDSEARRPHAISPSALCSGTPSGPLCGPLAPRGLPSSLTSSNPVRATSPGFRPALHSRHRSVYDGTERSSHPLHEEPSTSTPRNARRPGRNGIRRILPGPRGRSGACGRLLRSPIRGFRNQDWFGVRQTGRDSDLDSQRPDRAASFSLTASRCDEARCTDSWAIPNALNESGECHKKGTSGGSQKPNRVRMQAAARSGRLPRKLDVRNHHLTLM